MSQPKVRKNRTWLLLVEDDLITAQIIKKVLRDGFMLHHATYGQEALNLLEKYDFGIVLMDILLAEVPGMPYLTGFDILKHIRESRKFADMKVIAVTSNMMERMREDYIAAGFDDYVPKPITPQQVLELVETATS